jgi:hypothetical protein
MFCGGKTTQYEQNGWVSFLLFLEIIKLINLSNIFKDGKCGICGEDYAAPKRFEKGGDLYRGYVVRTYKSNQYIDTVVDVSFNGE